MTQMHKRGVLAAVICSDPFRTLGTTQARVLGVLKAVGLAKS